MIFVYVPYEISEERLKSRGREEENGSQFQERLARAKDLQVQPDADLVIDNSGPLEIGTTILRDYLLSLS